MNEHLKAAATTGNIEMLYAQIQTDPYVLEHLDAIPFADTPLHTAASAGKITFAIEIITLKPSFAWKLNEHGLSPMHIALESRDFEMVRRLVDINKDLIRDKGKNGLTPLHFVSRDGRDDLLAEFLSTCPDSIQDVTVRNETALHVAANHRQFKALNVLVRWLRCNCRKGAKDLQISMLNWKDEDGNTILHILAGHNDPNPQMVQLLIHCKINTNSKNSGALTALDIVERLNQDNNNVVEVKKMLQRARIIHSNSVKKMLQHARIIQSDSVRSSQTLAEELLGYKITFLRSMRIDLDRFRDNISNDTRNIFLGVAVLVATCANQAALSPPGGVYQSEVNGGSDLLGVSIMGIHHFQVFMAFNVVALLASTLIIYVLMPATEGLTLLLTFPLFYFVFAFLFSLLAISPNIDVSRWEYIVIATTVITLLELLRVGRGRNRRIKSRIIRDNRM